MNFNSPLTAALLKEWWDFIGPNLGGYMLYRAEPAYNFPYTGFYIYRASGRARLTFVPEWYLPDGRDKRVTWDVTGDTADATVTVSRIRKAMAASFMASAFVQKDEELREHLRFSPVWGVAFMGRERSAEWFFRPRPNGLGKPVQGNVEEWIAVARAERGRWAADDLTCGGRLPARGVPLAEVIAALGDRSRRRIAHNNISRKQAGGYLSMYTNPSADEVLAALEAAGI